MIKNKEIKIENSIYFISKMSKKDKAQLFQAIMINPSQVLIDWKVYGKYITKATEDGFIILKTEEIIDKYVPSYTHLTELERELWIQSLPNMGVPNDTLLLKIADRVISQLRNEFNLTAARPNTL